jgi:invasion protein IalB
MIRHTPSFALVAALLFAAMPGVANAGGATVTGSYGPWSFYTSEGANYKICFAAAAPEEKKPATANRATPLFYISAWPKDGVRGEVSVKLGYPIKAGSAVNVQVGDESFKLFAKDERAYIADTTQELKLIEAMKKGSKLTVQATSERGTETTDTYSLSGLSKALDDMAGKCS